MQNVFERKQKGLEPVHSKFSSWKSRCNNTALLSIKLHNEKVKNLAHTKQDTYSYVMNRMSKQILYGVIYIVFLCGLLWGAYRLFFYQPPSCLDMILNQDEEEMDCGGTICQSCALKNKQELIVGGAEIFPVSDNQSTIAFTVRNSNKTLGKNDLNYTINIYAGDNQRALFFHRTTFIYPNETILVVEPGVTIPSNIITRAELIIEDQQWLPIDVFQRPKGVVISHITSSSTPQGIKVVATVLNDNSFALNNVDVVASILNTLGFRAGVSRTTIENVPAFSQRDINIDIPLLEDQRQNIDYTSLDIFINAKR